MCDRLQMGTARASGTRKDSSYDYYTLRIRCGKNGGGKGALIQTNKSGTLSCNNDQTLFVPIDEARNICLNDQGGAFMSISYGKAGTLRAQMDGHPPVVLEKNDET